MDASSGRRVLGDDDDDVDGWLVAGGYTLLRRVVARALQRPLLSLDVEDTTQDAALRVYRAWNNYQASRGTRDAWASRIARNVAIDQLRRQVGHIRGPHETREQRRRNRVTLSLSEESVLFEAEQVGLLLSQDSFESFVITEFLCETWACVPDHLRVVFQANANGYTLAELEERLGYGRSTLRGHTLRLRQRLHDAGYHWH